MERSQPVNSEQVWVRAALYLRLPWACWNRVVSVEAMPLPSMPSPEAVILQQQPLFHHVFLKINTAKLQTLSEISRVAWDFYGCFWRQFTIEKNASTLMVRQGKKQLDSNSRCIVARLVTHMKHLHTCLAKISLFVLSQQRKILV